MSVARFSLVLCCLAGLAACATDGRTPIAGRPNYYRLADGRVLRCEPEMTTGSHVREMVCHPDAEKTATEKEELRQALDRPTIQLLK